MWRSQTQPPKGEREVGPGCAHSLLVHLCISTAWKVTEQIINNGSKARVLSPGPGIYISTTIHVLSYNKHVCVCACVRACVCVCVPEGHRK